MENSLTDYLKNLRIVKYNLTKFYYNSASEWLKKDVLSCISSINEEIKQYEQLLEKNKEKEKYQQVTIFDVGGVLCGRLSDCC